jgi:hypothetical protein
MKTPNSEVVKLRTKQFAERADVRNLGILLVAGLLHPFDYIDKVTDLALQAGIDAPVVLN